MEVLYSKFQCENEGKLEIKKQDMAINFRLSEKRR